MTDTTELAQREKFEAWFKSSFHPDKTGPYIKDQLYFAWKAAGAELVEALEKVQQYAKERDAENQDLMLTVGRLRVEREELESRTVKLPERYAWQLGYIVPDPNGDLLDLDDVIAALAAAGIKVEAE
ncbi:ead/Ea22-like family protein [Raoultella planticola]|uniref:ead/Ea22-like family protein n=1 Tax=Raoultella planticola TaxID=575 RepID=UPI001F536216|nr:ead/Ea22-like family protein [Raoultella planticola]UNK76090.1 ead/Ea22-like family protein [Raoultella planticola]